jgi:hypothetical protein
VPKAHPKPMENDGVRPARHHFLLGRGLRATPTGSAPNQAKMTACGLGAVIFSLSAISRDSGPMAHPKLIENDGVRPGRRRFLLAHGLRAMPDRKRAPNQTKMKAYGLGAVISSLSAVSKDSGPKARPKPITNDGVRPGRRHFLLVRGLRATPDRKRTPNQSKITAYGPGAVIFSLSAVSNDSGPKVRPKP